ncbi:hypothetical protein Pint_11628 [Pistacia integerrima]|uniref:Uncharacterized protein n=1 Tax=Pistacia integerrima TaxID=434235 RepID=A0ACC0XI35_9ROSI|nr:hypothetical protein Pint_11628 [Pistacia integerrima]
MTSSGIVNGSSKADQLSATGKSIENNDLISYVVGGLNPIFTPFITILNFATRDHSISFDDFQTELLNFEQLLEAQNKNLPSEGTQMAFFTNKHKPHYGRKPKFLPQKNQQFTPPNITPNTSPNPSFHTHKTPPSKPQTHLLFQANSLPVKYVVNPITRHFTFTTEWTSTTKAGILQHNWLLWQLTLILSRSQNNHGTLTTVLTIILL